MLEYAEFSGITANGPRLPTHEHPFDDNEFL